MKMRNISGAGIFTLAILLLAGVLWAQARPPLEQPLTAAERKEEKAQNEVVYKILNRALSVKPGQTRKDLLKVFTTEGGLSNTLWRTYVYRTCPNVKVDVEFRVVGRPERDAEGRLIAGEDDSDVITKISRPYLAWTIAD